VIVLKIEYVATDDLIPYIHNSRTHSEAQVKQIAASIREFGFTNPILIDDEGTIIAGHGRVMAAKVLQLDQVPTITLGALSDAQRKAYVIADNKLALNAGWDTEVLLAEIESLQDLNFDTQLLGFSADELSEMLNIEEIELKEESYAEIFNVIVECGDEMEQEKIFNQLEAEGYKCRVQSL
jgi:ParB-like chromosome segregation protein Spo0J